MGETDKKPAVEEWSTMRDLIATELNKTNKLFLSDYLSKYRRSFERYTRRLTPASSAYTAKLLRSWKPGASFASSLPPSHPLLTLRKQSDLIDKYTRSLLPKEVQSQNKSLRKSIADLNERIGRVFPRGTRPIPVTERFYRPFEQSAAAAETALTPKPGKALSLPMARAALPAVVDFAEKLGAVTELVIRMTPDAINVTAKMETGATKSMTQAVPRRASISRNALEQEPAESAATTTKAAADPWAGVGDHARRLLAKPPDWEHRILVFKDGGKYKQVQVPSGSNGAWKYMERLIRSQEPNGWVELEGKNDSNWTAAFNRRDENGVVDTMNPLTVLYCRIEAWRQRGRQKTPGPSAKTKKANPRIHLVKFDRMAFKELKSNQKAAEKRSKLNPKAPK